MPAGGNGYDYTLFPPPTETNAATTVLDQQVANREVFSRGLRPLKTANVGMEKLQGAGDRRQTIRLSVLLFVCTGLLAVTGTTPANGAVRHQFTIAAGTRWATPCYVQDSGVPGPVVMIVAGLHGDEPAGSWAAAEMQTWAIARGKLILLPKANAPGLEAFSHYLPGVEKDVRNLDRRFAQPESRSGAEDSPAPAIWRLVAEERPNWLVDLHEGISYHQSDPKSAGSSVACGGTGAAQSAVAGMLGAVNRTIAEENKKFVLGEPPAEGSLAWAAGRYLGSHTLLAATTGQNQPLALRVRQQRTVCHALLASLDMLDTSVSTDQITSRDGNSSGIRLAVYAGAGTGKGMHHLLVEMQGLPGSTVLPIGPEEIRAGELRHFNVVLFPGGSGSRQGESLGEVDRRCVRQFVEQGGGYIGICAGAFLATAEWPNALNILDAKTPSTQWKRGRGVVQMELTPEGRKILHVNSVSCEVRYHNGPIFMPAERSNLPEYRSLAVFRSQVADYSATDGGMVGAPAIVASQFGKGRIVCFSPHPEATKGLEDLVRRGVRWVAGNG